METKSTPRASGKVAGEKAKEAATQKETSTPEVKTEKTATAPAVDPGDETKSTPRASGKVAGDDSVNRELEAENQALKDENEALKQDNEALKGENTALDELIVSLQDQLVNAGEEITELEKKAEKKKPKQRPQPAGILAVKDGEERVFPEAAWNNLGKDKNGWVRKASTPKEAQ